MTPGSDYKVKITSTANAWYFDWSDNNFSITAAPSLTVTAPNGGESWQQGTNQTITWDSSGYPGANVKIELYEGGVLNSTIVSSTANDGSYVWQISGSQTPGNDCQIKITSTTNTWYFDWSDNFFSIMPASELTVISPNGGEVWLHGTVQTIVWVADESQMPFKIELYRAAVLVTPIADMVFHSGSYGSYMWVVPPWLPEGNHYRIKIESLLNPGYFDWSDHDFSIRSSRPSNNNFADRLALTGASATVTGTNVGATKEPGEPNHAGNAGGASVWWTWAPPCTGSVEINTFGRSFDMTLGGYTGSTVSTLALVASNDDSGGGLTSRVTFEAIAGTPYQIAVDGYGGASGDIVLHAACLYPALLVTGNGTEIPGGNAAPTSADGTDFGTAAVGGSPASRTFTVQNTGDGTLTTGNLIVPPGFTVTESLSSSIPAGASDTFTVRLDTTVTGVKSGEIRLESNDQARNPFRFRVKGTVVDFVDDFETYPGGAWPAGWRADGNAASYPSRNLVVTDPLDPANKALQLYGLVGQSWGALAYHPVDFGQSYTLSLRIYNGEEAIPSTGHQQRAGVGMRHGTTWSNPGFGLLSCHKNESMVAADGSVLQSYSTNRWYDVRISFQRNSTEIQVAYRIDGVNRGVVSVPVPDWLDNTALDHIDFSANAGAARFDDVKLVQRTPAESWQNASNPLDVSANGVVEPYDVLLLINEINRNGGRALPPRTLEHEGLPYYDVNGDGYLTPLDVLMVITHINLASSPTNGSGGEGESATEWGYGSQTPTSRTTSLIVDRPEMFRGKSFDQPRRVSGADTLVQPAFDLSRWLDAEREELDFESILDERMADDDDLDIFFGRLGLQKEATWEALCQQLDVQASVS